MELDQKSSPRTWGSCPSLREAEDGQEGFRALGKGRSEGTGEW